jgi:hypothetical protein
MKKIPVSLIIFLILGFSTGLYAAEEKIPANSSMVYNVTIKKIETYNSTTGAWLTLFSGSKTFNIASASAGATVGNIISGFTPTDGVYTKIRVTVGNQFGIKACHTYSVNGTTYCTNGTTVKVQNGSETHYFSAVSVGTYSTATTTTVTIDFLHQTTLPAGQVGLADGLQMTGDLPSPITVTAGSADKTIDIAFDLNEVFSYYHDNDLGLGSPKAISPGEPKTTVTVK